MMMMTSKWSLAEDAGNLVLTQSYLLCMDAAQLHLGNLVGELFCAMEWALQGAFWKICWAE